MSSRIRTRALPLTLVALLVATAGPAFAQWSADPAIGDPLCTAAGGQDGVQVISDAAGNATFVWRDLRTGDADIRAQRLAVTGLPQWSAQGIGVCTIAGAQSAPHIVAREGGALVVWEDARSDSGDIFAQRLDELGIARWTADGLAVCGAAGRQFAPAAAADDSGGVIVAWLDHRDGVNTSVYAQRLDPDGAPRWAVDGVPVCTVPGAHGTPTAIADGAGGAFITWADARGGYRARRVDRDGVVGWSADGVVLCAAGTPRDLQGIRDDAGGLLVAWDRTDATNFYRDVYALRLDAGGTATWPDTGVVISRARYLQRVPTLAGDGAGGAIVAWEDGRVFHLAQVYAQRVSAAGAPLWTTDGVPVCATDMTRPFPLTRGDGAGGAFIVWQDDRNGGVDLYAQRIDADGAPRWAVNGVAVSTAPDTQSAAVAAPDGAGGLVLGWVDGRDALTRSDVYAARLGPDGSLVASTTGVTDAAPGARELSPVRPDPARVSAEIRFTLPRASGARLEIFDVRGRRVRTLASGDLGSGVHVRTWDLRDADGREVPSGLYLVRLTAGGRPELARCMVLR